MSNLHTRTLSSATKQYDYNFSAYLIIVPTTSAYSLVKAGAFVQSAPAYACIEDREVAPPTANYAVSADVNVRSVVAGNSAGVLLRGSATEKKAYYLQLYADGTLKLQRDGPWGTLASVASPITAGSTYRITGVVDDDQISGYVDGVLKLGPITDAAITAAGYPGYVIWADSTGVSETTGMAILNLSLDTVGGGTSLNAAAAGTATASGTANASLSGGGSSLNAAATGAAVASGSAAATLSAPGTITIPELTEWETGNLLPGQTGITVWVNDEETGVLVVKLTGLTSHATTADCSVSHAAIVAGTDYSVRTRLASGAQYTWTYTAT